MGKQGPCYHCGVTSTPLWRNGPPEKPVLCNACGSRWRTKGTLVNYTPLHSRAEGDEIEIDDRRAHQRVMIKGMSLNKKIPKRKTYQENFTVKRANLEFSTGFKRKALDEDASNRSSSGSVVSNSESCAQSNAWETTFPCKRRTGVGRPKAASSVEKLTKDLYTILQEQQSSCLSGSSECDLLFENETPMLLGHGSVLMRDPHSSGAREEESEASSFLVESSKSSSVHSAKFGGKAIKQELLKRSKSQVLGRHSLLLCSIDLKAVFNFDEFIEKFTEEEQKKLMKLLPQVDSVDRPDSLRSMFESSQFKENFSLFQQLVADGVFETSSSSGSKLEDIKTLAKLALSDPNKSHLLESYYMLKEQRKEIEDSVTTPSRVSNLSPSNNNSLVTIERPCESLNQNFSETRVVMRSPKEVMKIRSNHIKTEEILENSVSSFNPMSCGGSLVFSYEDNDISDQDLLLDVPSNGSFPQAELLHMI
ncbi:PREDICTED: GATA transcription factor 27-like isoform X1 [Camelina sativa]|uniref:GATA transcription factor 27-like isoform X1 n=1 Tax=Camelina sativa TaxID=90675 RepID=A0ABM0UI51_CAMSA|nr:PREDICTED: GATA transcription factor 27-like isoform X1 [Camelina sativa]